MGILNRLFDSNESIAREIETDDEAILKYWITYLNTVSKKKDIFDSLTSDTYQIHLSTLKKLLDLELIDLFNEEKEESELIADLETLEHSQKIKRVHKLEQCLDYAATKYEYVYGLLKQLHSILNSQTQLILKLQQEAREIDKLISHLKLQSELETEIINKIIKIKPFHELLSILIKGEHIIKKMDDDEKVLLKKMHSGMNKIFSGEISDGITYDWAMTVFNAIEDKVHEGVANEIFPGYHSDIDFEYVNRPEFIDLVRISIQSLRQKDVSEKVITVFVHIFREWYNHERD